MSSSISHNEKELFALLAKGDEPAFRELFDMYKERLFAFVMTLMHSKADAEEIVQDVFLKLWEHRHALDKVEHPRNYIYTMARNRCFDFLVKAARNHKLMKQVWANMQPEENVSEELLQARESQKLIHQALQELTEKKRAIFRLSREEGMPHQEIADQLGLSKSTVKNTIVDVLKYIKTFLVEHKELLVAFASFVGS